MFQDLLKYHKIKKPILGNTNMLGQYNEGYYLKIVLLHFTKLSVEYQLGHMLLNIYTSHIEIFSILCIQFVLCMYCQFVK